MNEKKGRRILLVLSPWLLG